MMALETWLLFIATEVVLALRPGPVVMYVVSQGMSRGHAHALWGAGGVLTANTLYFALSATGVGGLLLASSELFLVVKWVGAAFIIYIGVRTLFAEPKSLELEKVRAEAGLPPYSRAGLGGFMLQAANPNLLVYFLAIIPQFVDPARPLAPQVLILGATSVVLECMVLAGYGWGASRAARVEGMARHRRLLNRIGGVLLIAVGAGLARVEIE